MKITILSFMLGQLVYIAYCISDIRTEVRAINKTMLEINEYISQEN